MIKYIVFFHKILTEIFRNYSWKYFMCQAYQLWLKLSIIFGMGSKWPQTKRNFLDKTFTLGLLQLFLFPYTCLKPVLTVSVLTRIESVLTLFRFLLFYFLRLFNSLRSCRRIANIWIQDLLRSYGSIFWSF
jgi:hypothetical protein